MKWDIIEAGLPREWGIVMEAVIRAKLGWGDGMRGRGEAWSWSSDMAAVVKGVGM